ncbi:STAS domain-containing protein [Geomicrobium sediminis]|uniref:RsbT co-antagonist protein RsbR n=1 Tax=Geomicrobium sediminis TaxID=1347788 RepID=A0ABS2PAA3_9BACL|nr:STAS domain-containing protein [Geomicrobium sediminis]MBM7632348.1 rsbT co-antagonist protein RsbR [Geomicrobium sediminis]
MSDKTSLLYQHFFEGLEQTVQGIVEATSENSEEALTENEKELHRQLLLRLLQKVKKALLNQDSTEELNLDYDATNELAQQGYELEYIIQLLSKFRIYALQEVEHELRRSLDSFQESNQGEQIFQFLYQITEIFDQAIAQSTEYYNSRHQLRLVKLEEELLDLSAPIVPVKENISIMPIIGVMSDDRATHILNNVVPMVSEQGVETLILDLSAIHMFDTYAASRFFTVTGTLSLLGIRTIITGVRPDMAQTTVQLGVKLAHLEVYQDVKTALEKLE